MNMQISTMAVRALLLLLMALTATPALAQDVVYYHTDALGTPVAMTDANGVVIQRREFEPYGYQLEPTPLADGPGFTGHVSDAATGLVYMQQRYYDAVIGRLLSVDPVTAYNDPVGAFNRYRYANSNPYRFMDPDGRSGCDLLGLCPLPAAMKDPAMARADAIIAHDGRMVVGWWAGTAAVGGGVAVAGSLASATGGVAGMTVGEAGQYLSSVEGRRALALACGLLCRDPVTGNFKPPGGIVKIIQDFERVTDASKKGSQVTVDLIKILTPAITTTQSESSSQDVLTPIPSTMEPDPPSNPDEKNRDNQLPVE